MKTLTYLTLIALFFLQCNLICSAQTPPAKQWDARFGAIGDEDLNMIQQTTDGGYILGGVSPSGISGDKTQNNQGGVDYWIVKTDAAGTMQWDATFGGSADDYLNAVQQTSDGGYILGGYSYSGISGDKTQSNWDPSNLTPDFWVIKTDANGIKQWEATFGAGSYDYLLSLRQTSDGGYILGGNSYASGTSGDVTQPIQGINDCWIVKTDANGVKQWDARYGGSLYEGIYDIQQTADGGYILGITTYSGNSGDVTQPNQGSADYWIVKTDGNGIKQWDALFGGSSTDNLTSIQQTIDGGYILGGSSYSGISGDKSQNNYDPSNSTSDYWIVKTDGNGAKQWDVRFGTTVDDQAGEASIRQTIDGGYIIGGSTPGGISGDKTQANRGPGFTSDFWIVKTNGSGVFQWDASFGGSQHERFRHLQQTGDGGFILAGGSNSDVTGGFDHSQVTRGGYDYWIIKLSPECIQQTFYADADNDGFGDEGATTMACTAPTGYVSDNTDCNDGNASINPGVTEACNSVDDDCDGIVDDTRPPLQWDATFGGSGTEGNGNGSVSIQQTSDGGYILGASSNSGISGEKTQNSYGGYDYWIAKTDANGVKQWDKTFGGTSDDFIWDLEQTSDGGYILGGTSYSNADGNKTAPAKGGADFWIIKTNSLGDIEWDKTFGGEGIAGYNNDDCRSIQQADDGGYILGGTSSSSSGNDKSQNKIGYWIVKINSSGDKEWDASFMSSGNDFLSSVQQTSDGGYILAGASLGSTQNDKSQDNFGTYDYWILKCDAFGAKQWDASFGGSDSDIPENIMQASDGGYVVEGYSYSGVGGNKTSASKGAVDAWIIKTNSAGAKLWEADLGGTSPDYLSSLQIAPDGSIILGGESASGISGDKTQDTHGNYDYWLVKLDANGVKQWDGDFGGGGPGVPAYSSIDGCHSIYLTTDGGYILGGNSNSCISGDKTQESRGDYDFWMIKVGPEGTLGTYYADADNDGYGNPNVSTMACSDAPSGYVSNSGDCNDANSSVHPTCTDNGLSTFYADADNDGYGNPHDSIEACSAPGGYVSDNTDCNDNDASVHSVSVEICNGLDDDCDGIVDDTRPPKEWDARFGGNADDFLGGLSGGIQQTADGGYIIGGESSSGASGDRTQPSQGGSDYWVVKTDANGTKEWDARFGGSANDLLRAVQQTSDGGYILGGESSSGVSGDKTEGSQGGTDFWIVKTDASGVKQWDKRFGGDENDGLYAMQQTTDGGYILAGPSRSGISGDKSQSNRGGQDYWVVKTDANGVKQWDVRFGTITLDVLNTIHQTSDGGYILGGTSAGDIDGDKTGSSRGNVDYWIVKIDASGNKQWDSTYGGSDFDDLFSIRQTSDGKYIMTGRSASDISGEKSENSRGPGTDNDAWVVKASATGVKEWDATFGGSDYDELRSIRETFGGGFILGGLSNSSATGDKSQLTNGSYDFWLLKIDDNGIKQWDASFGGASEDGGYHADQTADGSFIIAGQSVSCQSGDKSQESRGNSDFWIVKTNVEGTSATFYSDGDGDGYGNPNISTVSCTQPSGYVANDGDCNDSNPFAHPCRGENCDGTDENCDGVIDEGFDLDGDSYTTCNGDCNDANAAIHPGATEVCNLMDDDCDGMVDEGVQFTFYADSDNDGYGNLAVTTMACSVPPGYVSNNTDNDANTNDHPGAPEICNTMDDDCDGMIDEGVKSTFYADADNDGYGNLAVTTMACSAPPGYVSNNTDCNDANANVYPGATEVCNVTDDDCDGMVDEGVQSTFYADADNDGYGNPAAPAMACSPPPGYVSNNTDCNDANANVYPGATEICNTIDDDCDGMVDEGVKSTFYADGDNDGYGNTAVTTMACSPPPGYVSNNTDCNDANANVHPGATEICNTIDDDCDGMVDEGVKSTFYADADNDGYGNPAVTTMACTAPSGYVSNNTDCNDANANVHPGATEILNGIDDDCDGQIDEGTCSISVNAGLDEDTYFGYSADQCVTHTAAVSGGTPPYTYTWTLDRPLLCNSITNAGDESFTGGSCSNNSCPSSGSLSTPPSCHGAAITACLLDTAMVCVTVTDVNGCTATDCFVMRAEDVRCFAGNSGIQKVKMCHNGKTICIDESAVAAHLAIGDYLGPCHVAKFGNNVIGSLSSSLRIYPNPSDGRFVVVLTLNESENEQAVIDVMNMLGQSISSEKVSITNGELKHEISLDQSIAQGLYRVQVTVNGVIYFGQIVYQK